MKFEDILSYLRDGKVGQIGNGMQYKLLNNKMYCKFMDMNEWREIDDIQIRLLRQEWIIVEVDDNGK